MDGIYGLHQPSTAVVAEMDEYSDKGLMSAAAPHENLMFPPPPSSSVYHHQQQHNHLYGSLREGRFGRVFGSDELISMTASTMSETASTIDPPPQPTNISGVCGGGGIWRGKNNNDDDDNGDVLSVIKAKIASHPRYPCLLQAYIDCQKVGAPPEIACLLDEIQRGNNVVCRSDSGVSTSWLGADPELDDFMETYCNALNKYKSDLSRPFEEAKTFLNKIETQLTNLCNGAVVHMPSAAVSSDEEYSGGEIDVQDLQLKDEERDLKDRLHRRFGSHISSLKLEFSKKKKKGKLPRDARQLLLDWWNLHSKWPYPTEADKITLADSTGLDQRQINNWFINQRKRHWKSSVNMQFALMDDISG